MAQPKKKDSGVSAVQIVNFGDLPGSPQWLRLWASNAGGMGSIPDWRTKISRAAQCGQSNSFLKPLARPLSFCQAVLMPTAMALTFCRGPCPLHRLSLNPLSNTLNSIL